SLQCSLAHRYLHSFPTRRSSDLAALGSAARPRSVDAAALGSAARPRSVDAAALGSAARPRAGAPTLPPSPSTLPPLPPSLPGRIDRKSTRLNSSHLVISYAVFGL